MGGKYGDETHAAIKNSLLRLNSAHIRVRYGKVDGDIPKLLAIILEDGVTPDQGRHKIWLQVPESLAELFGPGNWTKVNVKISRYDALKGWIANFYATHTQEHWLPVKALQRLSGYSSHNSNFKNSLNNALLALESLKTSLGPIKSYSFGENETKLLVKTNKPNASNNIKK